MLEHIMSTYLPEIITLIEIIGIFVVVTGCFKCFYEYVKCSLFKKSASNIRHNFGTSMVIGLEFKMAAEILRTVIVRSKEEIFMLGGIIILRALLSYLIKRDIADTAGEHSKAITGIHIDRD